VANIPVDGHPESRQTPISLLMAMSEIRLDMGF
jgi:hypothetical protein